MFNGRWVGTGEEKLHSNVDEMNQPAGPWVIRNINAMVLVHDFLSVALRVADLRRPRSEEGSEDLRLRCLTSTKCHSSHNEASTRAIIPPHPIRHSPRPSHPTTSPTRRPSLP